ncbi:MAG: DUF1295 domain-containing protein [Clostridia bacterium]|nr:DUF1295 domain-containing protein [Clostridia bacterium]
MRLKQNRKASFAIVFVVYVIATMAGIWTYNKLSCDLWLNLLIADVVATVVTFVFSVVFGNASVYDPYWSVQPVVILCIYAFSFSLSASGVVILCVVALWGARLTANWAYTFGGLDCQDWRYTMLKQKTGVFYPVINFVGIHMVPTLVVYMCVLPAVYVMVYAPALNVFAVLCACLSCFAFCMQGVADVQMHRFRKNGQGGFIRDGLWHYSRHPNYLGEILMWWGVGLFALCLLPQKWFLLAGAVANTLLFLFVSVPLAEGRQSQKQGFDEYKKQTRKFLPIKK